MTLRRGLFTLALQKDQAEVILAFFARIESDLPGNHLQK